MCLWFDTVISFFSWQKQERVKPFSPNVFCSEQGMNHLPFPPSHLPGKAKRSKLGYEPLAAEGREGGLQSGVFLPKQYDKKQSPHEDKLVCFIS